MPKRTDPLKAYREKHSLSQQELADMLGKSRQMIGFLEAGERPYTAEMCVLIENRIRIPRAVFRPDLFTETA